MQNHWLRPLAGRILYLAGMLFLISALTFFAVNLAPNSFLAAGELNPNITPEQIQHLKSIYGLDQNLWQRYLSWMGAFMHLDFGFSFTSGKPVRLEILERLPITLLLNVISMVLIFAFSLWLGVKAAFKAEGGGDRGIKQLALVSYALPNFYLAVILIMVFGVGLEWFPLAGLHDVPEDAGWHYYLDTAWHLVLPVSVMAFGGIGSLLLYVRALTLEILKSDYIFFAKARGIEGRALFMGYVLPNLAPPLVTVLGLSLPGLIGGSVILETIFSINGMGLLFFQSALSRDYPVIMGILIIGAFLTLLGNMLADMVLARINPFFGRQKGSS